MQRSANRQSFSQRPAQQPPTNAKVMSTGSGPVSAQISSMFGPSHSQPLLHSLGGGGSSSGSSSNNRSMNDLPGVSTNYSWPLYSLSLCLFVTPAHLYPNVSFRIYRYYKTNAKTLLMCFIVFQHIKCYVQMFKSV